MTPIGAMRDPVARGETFRPHGERDVIDLTAGEDLPRGAYVTIGGDGKVYRARLVVDAAELSTEITCMHLPGETCTHGDQTPPR